MYMVAEHSPFPPPSCATSMLQHVKIFKQFQQINAQTETVYCEKDGNYTNCSKKGKEQI